MECRTYVRPRLILLFIEGTGHICRSFDVVRLGMKFCLFDGLLVVPGYILFLAFVIDRLHHYHRKLIMLKKIANTSREEVEKLQIELQGKDEKSSKEIKKLRGELANISEKMKKVKSESEEHERRRSEAEAHVNALQMQSEELLLEYDRLLEDNQILQTQVLSFRS